MRVAITFTLAADPEYMYVYTKNEHFGEVEIYQNQSRNSTSGILFRSADSGKGINIWIIEYGCHVSTHINLHNDHLNLI